MKLLYAVLVAAIMLPNVCAAQETDDPKAWSEKLLDLVISGESESIVDYLIEHSRVGQIRPDGIRGFKENFDKMYKGCGQSTEYELIEERTRGSYLLSLAYISRHEGCPLVWEFYFYKPKSRWNMMHFFLIDNIPEIFRSPVESLE